MFVSIPKTQHKTVMYQVDLQFTQLSIPTPVLEQASQLKPTCLTGHDFLATASHR